MPSCEAIWCRSLRRLRSRVDSSVMLLLHLSRLRCVRWLSSDFLADCSKLESPPPGLRLEGVDGVHESYHTGLGRHDDRVRPCAAPEVPDPFQGLARGDAGSREDHVGAPDQVVQREFALGVIEAVLPELRDLGALGRPHPGLHLPAQALHDSGGEDALGCPSYADDGVQVGPAHPHGYGGGEVALRPYLDARSRLPDLLYKPLVPVAVKDGDGYLRRPAAERSGDVFHVLRNRRVDVDAALRSRAHDQLAHVHVGRPEHAPPRGRGDGGDGALLPLYEQLQTFDGLDGEVGVGASGPERVARADYTGVALRRPEAPLLVQALLAQHGHPAGDGYPAQLLAERLGGERVGPLRVPRSFEVRDLQRHTLGYGGVLHGSRSDGPRVGIGNVNGLSPNLHTHQDRPHATRFSRGCVCVETVRNGPLSCTWNQRNLPPTLYTSYAAPTSGLPLFARDRLPGEPQ